MIRVLVVDDHEMVAEGLTEVLSATGHIEVVGRAGTVADAERLATQLSPDVVVMDYRLPDGDGLTAAAAIRGRNPDTAVVMVTASDHETLVTAAVEAGCSAYVTKDRAGREVVSAVETAARGDVAFPASVLGRLFPRATPVPRQTGALTPREIEVLQLMAEGRSSRDIADMLVLSVSTIRNHTQNVLTKLGAHSRLEAVTIATRQGIIRLPG